jgi:hypothetical protein
VHSVRFPPAYPAVLAIGQRLLFWVDAFHAHVWTSVVVGTLTAPLTALLAWRVCDRPVPGRRALVAAVAGALVALNPLLAGASVSLMSEALYLPLAALFLLLLDRVVAGGGTSARAALVLGAVVGAAALCRSEGAILLPAVVLVVAWRARSQPAVRRACVRAVAVAVAVIAAWSVVASLAAHRPLLLAANAHVLWGANCPPTYDGDLAGYWTTECPLPPEAKFSARARAAFAVTWPDLFEFRSLGARVEAELNQEELGAALERIRDHPGDFVSVMRYRVARAAGVYWTRGQERSEGFEGRDRRWEEAGRWYHAFVVLPLALVTAVAALTRARMRRRLRSLVDGRRLFPFGVLALLCLALAALTYGSARLRIVIEPALAVWAALGAVVLVAGLQRLAGRGR